MQNYLNNTTWGKQANIFFTVDPTVRPLAVNFDLDRDGKIADYYVHTRNEMLAIKNAVGADAPDAYDLYYIDTQFKQYAPNKQAAAIAPENTGAGWFGNLQPGGLLYTAAHETGHILGRNDHSPTAEEYKPDLMYETNVPGFNQCRVRKPDWNLVH